MTMLRLPRNCGIIVSAHPLANFTKPTNPHRVFEAHTHQPNPRPHPRPDPPLSGHAYTRTHLLLAGLVQRVHELHVQELEQGRADIPAGGVHGACDNECRYLLRSVIPQWRWSPLANAVCAPTVLSTISFSLAASARQCLLCTGAAADVILSRRAVCLQRWPTTANGSPWWCAEKRVGFPTVSSILILSHRKSKPHAEARATNKTCSRQEPSRSWTNELIKCPRRSG